jgi:hypothetical protein
MWVIAHDLTRAAGVLAGPFHARATTATLRAHLINVPVRLARRLTLTPAASPTIFAAVRGPTPTTASRVGANCSTRP